MGKIRLVFLCGVLTGVLSVLPFFTHVEARVTTTEKHYLIIYQESNSMVLRETTYSK